jgi:tripartite-type tricarboxylate transporter receptor subunit TctC
MIRTWTTAALAFAAAAALATAAEAQSGGNFYKGKQVNVIIGSAAGGGYDAYGRLVARHLPKHIPGTPNVIAQNMPGAGQTKAAGYVYAIAPKDGTAIAAVSPGALLVPVLGGPNIQYDPSKFQYIGSANSDVYVCITRPDSPVQKFADAFDKEWIVGVSSGTTRDMPMMLKNLLHAKLKLVAGYPGTKDITLAFERGEVQGICGFGYASLSSQYPDWVPSGKAKVILQESVKGFPELDKAGVPLGASFAKTPEDKRLMELVYSQGIFGRPFLVAPQVPKDRVQILRTAFMDTVKDPQVAADAKKMKLDLDAISGDEVQELVEKIYATPPAIIQRAKQVLETE